MSAPVRALRAARFGRHGLVVALLVLAVGLVLALPAAADPGGCHQAPNPARHGEGLVGQLDNAPIGQGVVGSPYYEMGYDALQWSTYGTTGVCALSYPWAAADTWLGNQLLSAAETITAAANGLHYMTLSNSLLPHFDQLMNELPVVLYDSVFTPYFALAALLSAVTILWWSHRGDMASIGKKVFWLLAGTAFASLTYLVPLAYTHIADDILVRGTAQLQGNVLRQSGSGGDPRDGLPDMLYNETLYRPWLAGEFGADTTPEARQNGRPLLQSQGCSKIETIERTCNTEHKQGQYTAIAGQIENTPAYPYFSGERGRTSAGATALIKASCYSLFQLACKAGLLLMQIIVRGLILAGPVIGLVAIVFNNTLPKVFRAAGGAVGMGIMLTLAGTVHAYILSWVAEPAHQFTPGMQLVIMVLVTYLMWIAVRPWRTLRQMAASTLGVQLPDPAQERLARHMRQRRRLLTAVGRGVFRRARRAAGGGFDTDFWGERGERDPAGAPAGTGDRDGSSAETGLARPAAPINLGGPGRPEGNTIRVDAERLRPDSAGTTEREPAMSTHGRAGELTNGPRALDHGSHGGPPEDPPPRGPRGGPGSSPPEPPENSGPRGPRGGPGSSPPEPPENSGPRGRSSPRPHGGGPGPDADPGVRDHPRPHTPDASNPSSSGAPSGEVVVPSEVLGRDEPAHPSAPSRAPRSTPTDGSSSSAPTPQPRRTPRPRPTPLESPNRPEQE